MKINKVCIYIIFGIVSFVGIEGVESVGDRGFFNCIYNFFIKKRRKIKNCYIWVMEI